MKKLFVVGLMAVIAALFNGCATITPVGGYPSQIQVQSQSTLGFRDQATTTYVSREADRSAQDWFQLDMRSRDAEVDNHLRLRDQSLQEKEVRHSNWEETARRRESARRTREAEELRRAQFKAEQTRQTNADIRQIGQDFLNKHR